LFLVELIMTKNTETVKVIVRARPINANELAGGSTCVVDIDQSLC
jgi:hypothetical protein